MGFRVGFVFDEYLKEDLVVYRCGEVMEVWSRQEAMQVAVSILHTLSVIKEEEVLIETYNRLGVGENQITVLVDEWHKQRDILQSGEQDEQVRDNNQDNSL